ncbi:hypothetical protein GCM10009122_08990 [Fulvivirga kasyanovii]|uniref:Lipopolysaccharide biosynthesis protein n=1 Tax=Fulvivirga kasyanovii TaxID=396812 RepID=A0ABW9RXV0_9BACT|nr:oligosaccharide flippase family protein [Fulvivirga kasyanovii]MTI29094.1 hypothetical protein [Fulvivirga kasyanovii]
MINHLLKSKKTWVLADQAVFSGTSFLTTIMLARTLDAMAFGLFASIVVFIYLAISMISALIIQPFQVTLSVVRHRTGYLSFIFWAQLLTVIALIGLVFIAFKISTPLLNNYIQLQVEIICFTTGFIFQDFFRKLLLAQSQVKKAFMYDMLTAMLHICVLGYALVYKSPGLGTLLLLLSAGYMPTLLAVTISMRPFPCHSQKWKSYLITHIQQGKWLFMSALVQWWSGNLFVVASGIFLGIEALGAFRLVQSLFGVLNVLLQAFENYALPQTSRLLTRSPELAKSYLRRISSRSAVFFGALLVLIFLFSTEIITLAGGMQYARFAYVVKGMAILYLIIFLGYPTRMAIRAMVLNRHFFLGYVISLIIGLVSFQYLLEQYQLMGALAGLMMSQLALLTFWQLILRKNNFLLWK